MRSSGDDEGKDFELPKTKESNSSQFLTPADIFATDIRGNQIEVTRRNRKQLEGQEIVSNLNKHKKFREGRCLNCKYKGKMGIIEIDESWKRKNLIRLPILLILGLLYFLNLLGKIENATLLILYGLLFPFAYLTYQKVKRIEESYAECPKCLMALRF